MEIKFITIVVFKIVSIDYTDYCKNNMNTAHQYNFIAKPHTASCFTILKQKIKQATDVVNQANAGVSTYCDGVSAA